MAGKGLKASEFSVVLKVDGANYAEWKSELLLYLSSNGWTYIVVDGVEEDEDGGVDVEGQQLDTQIKSLMIKRIVFSLRVQVLSLGTSKAVYSKLARMFEPKTAARITQLIKQLYASGMEPGEKVINYIGRVRQLSDTLLTAQAENALDPDTVMSMMVESDRQLADVLLSGLPEAYDGLITVMRSTTMAPSVELLTEKLLEHEELMSRRQAAAKATAVPAVVAAVTPAPAVSPYGGVGAAEAHANALMSAEVARQLAALGVGYGGRGGGGGHGGGSGRGGGGGDRPRRPVAEIKCHRCQQYGHYASSCTAPAPVPKGGGAAAAQPAPAPAQAPAPQAGGLLQYVGHVPQGLQPYPQSWLPPGMGYQMGWPPQLSAMPQVVTAGRQSPLMAAAAVAPTAPPVAAPAAAAAAKPVPEPAAMATAATTDDGGAQMVDNGAQKVRMFRMFMALPVQLEKLPHGPSDYLLDSGATSSVTYDPSDLFDLQPLAEPTFVQIADGRPCAATHSGSMILRTQVSDTVEVDTLVKEVLLVPALGVKALSVGALADRGVGVTMVKTGAMCYEVLTGEPLLHCRRCPHTGVYVVNGRPVPPNEQHLAACRQ